MAPDCTVCLCMTFIVILHGVCTKSWICGLLSFVTLTIFLAGILWILFLSNYCLSFWDYSYMYVGSLHSFHLLPPACIRLDIFHWPIFRFTYDVFPVLIQVYLITEFLILGFVFSVLKFTHIQVLTMFSSIFLVILIVVMFLSDDSTT